MLDAQELKEPHAALASRIASIATRAPRTVGDILDLAWCGFGIGNPTAPADA